MAHRVELVIGGHKATGERQLDTILETVSKYVASFSCWVGYGVWHGTREESSKVEVFCEDLDWVDPCVDDLLVRLDQDAIEVIIDGEESLRWRG